MIKTLIKIETFQNLKLTTEAVEKKFYGNTTFVRVTFILTTFSLTQFVLMPFVPRTFFEIDN